MRRPSGAPVTAGDLLTLEELGRLRRTSTRRGAGLVLHAWATIAGAIALYALWPSPWTLGVAVVVIGTRQLGLIVLMHETSHWLLFPSGPANTRVGTWLCAAPLGEDLRVYRRRHHQHHRLTQQPDDPDLALSAGLPCSRGRLALALLADAAGLTALAAAARWRPWRDGPGVWRRARAPLLANAVLACGLVAAGGWSLYVLTWLLPWVTWYRVVSRIRNIAEHGLVDGAEDPLRSARSIGAGPVARALVAPYRVNYHLEHHLLVFVPCWKLPQVHELLRAKGYGDRIERSSGYLEVLDRATARRIRGRRRR
ncbi:MAG TPA: fatty acid desaturase family protein [Gemmatimonadales bacterium]|nr:fatty acid desaturase family protein [Gemmatimonadales bacterium]